MRKKRSPRVPRVPSLRVPKLERVPRLSMQPRRELSWLGRELELPPKQLT